MKHIVITGGSRGIGFGLLCSFLELGHKVTFSGTSIGSVSAAIDKTADQFPKDSINGVVCDVRNTEDISSLWEKAAQFSPIDIWINNAGITQPDLPLSVLDKDAIHDLISINIEGLIQSTVFVYNQMLKQGFGTIFNMEGFGSDNRKMKNIGLYGMSKKAVRYYTESFVLETKNSPVNICFLSPGMVITDLLLKEYRDNPEKNREAFRIFNILADEVETVTPWLAKRILQPSRHGRRVAWLTTGKIISRFLMSPFRKRDVISKHL